MKSTTSVEMANNIILMPLSALKPYEKNSRTHSPEQIQQIAESIVEFGFTNPILIDKAKGIIAGHGRLAAAKELGLERVPTIELTHLTETQKRAYIIADNKLAENAGWDEKMLALELADLEIEDFDLNLTGFSNLELSELIPESQKYGEKKGAIKDDEIPDVPQNIHGVERGQIWQLGSHRLMCGDSTSKDDVEKLMAGEKADITFTSPPYNAAKNSHLHGYDDSFSGKYENNNDAMDDSDYVQFLIKSCDLALHVSDYAFWNIQLLAHNKVALINWLGNYSDRLKDVLIWNKATCPPNIVKGAFNTKFEFVFCFAEGKKVSTRGFPVTWQGKFPNVIETENNSGNDHAEDHRAGFPVAFPMWALEKLDFVESVYEPFCGTGTTIIACEKTNRKCYGMEIDPHYCSVIIERWQKFTNLKAQCLKT